MRLALALVALPVLLGQQPARDPTAPTPKPAGTASISGRVVANDGNAGNAEPIRKVRVELSTTDGTVARTDATDDNGAFVFRDLPAGRYTLSAFKSPWLDSKYGATRQGRAGTPIAIADGARLNGITLRMARGAVITGVVREVSGQPAAGVRVQVNRVSMTNGERSVSGTSISTETDDTGTYRIYGLPPGDVIVSASISSAINAFRDDGGSFRRVTAEDVNRANQLVRQGAGDMAPPGVLVRVATVLYPGTTDPAGAAVISLAQGEERAGIDLVMPIVPTSRIEGVITDTNGVPQFRNSVLAVSGGLQIGGLMGLNAALSASTDANGRYQLFGLAPGEYTVMAGGDKTWAEASIVVAGSGQDLNVPLTTRPLLSMSGRIIFEGGPPPNASGLRYTLRATGTLASLLALAAGGTVNLENGGTFESDIVPGKYQLGFLGVPAGWYPKSAIARGQDALDLAVEIGPNDRDTEFVVTFTNKPSELTGSLVDASGRPASDYFVIVFSTDRKFWTPPSRRVVQLRPGSDGAFSTKGLPAGDYFIAAMTDIDPDESLTPELLDSIVATSVRVKVIEGQKTVQPLKIGGG